MTKVLFISLLAFFVILKAQISTTYEITYKPDSTKSSYNTEYMTLKIKNKTSYFYNETKFKLDSIYNRVTAEYLKTGVLPHVSTKYELNFGFVKDFKNDYYTEIRNIQSKNFAFNIKKSVMVWKLLPDRNTILNYPVKKAQTVFGGRIWIACYTEEIPLNDGPYKFFGLPGLILDLKDSASDYHFKVVTVKKNEEDVKLPKNIISLTEEKYISLKNKIINDPAVSVRESVMQSPNVVMKDTKGKIMNPNELFDKINQEFFEFVKQHNNPLEKGDVWIK